MHVRVQEIRLKSSRSAAAILREEGEHDVFLGLAAPEDAQGSRYQIWIGARIDKSLFFCLKEWQSTYVKCIIKSLYLLPRVIRTCLAARYKIFRSKTQAILSVNCSYTTVTRNK